MDSPARRQRGPSAAESADGAAPESAPTTCAFCEYFDAGGEARTLLARSGAVIEGDCLNSHSPRFQTAGNETCSVFFPDSSLGSES